MYKFMGWSSLEEEESIQPSIVALAKIVFLVLLYSIYVPAKAQITIPNCTPKQQLKFNVVGYTGQTAEEACTAYAVSPPPWTDWWISGAYCEGHRSINGTVGSVPISASCVTRICPLGQVLQDDGSCGACPTGELLQFSVAGYNGSTADEACHAYAISPPPWVDSWVDQSTCYGHRLDGTLGSTTILAACVAPSSCPSGQRYFEDVQSCVDVQADSTPLGNANDNSCPKDAPTCGNPIHPGNANKIQRDVDFTNASGLALIRTYNGSPYNTDSNTTRLFGKRWSSAYDQHLFATPNRQRRACYRRLDNNTVFCELYADAATGPSLAAVRANGQRIVFMKSDVTWTGDANSADRVSATYNSDGSIADYRYTAADGDATERYDGSSGRLYSVTSRSGTVQQFVYSDGNTNDTRLGKIALPEAPTCTQVHPGAVLPAGRLLCVVDHWGRQLNFEYDAKGRVTKVIDPAGQPWRYEYDGTSGGCATASATNRACSADNLTKVTYPDGNSKTYHYNEAALINGNVACSNTVAVGNGFGPLLNVLTGISDENGVRYASWNYDCLGRPIASQHAGGVDRVDIAYGTYDSNGIGISTVTHRIGSAANPQTTTRQYRYQMILAQAKNTAIDQPCVECGDAKSRSYDANGNLASRTDWNGTKSCYAYDTTRNLETVRLEGMAEATTCSASLALTSLAAPQRKTNTQWHARYRLPLTIAEPNKRTSYTYDDHGNLLTRTEQATSDANGASGLAAQPIGNERTWRYTYNDVGQALTATDSLGAVTIYSYDDVGNLVSVTDGVGQVTTLSHYDAHGRAGQLVDANGNITELAYSLRGWLISRTTGGETTAYDYDGVGQLTKVTLPDGASIAYTYDDAHRLTAIADNTGNRIVYTLDLRGNRTADQVTDPTGTLSRRSARVYDTLNRLQQATGARQ